MYIKCLSMLVFFTILQAISAGEVSFRPCNGQYQPTEAFIDGCEFSNCVLYRGKPTNFSFTMKTNASIAKLEGRVYIKIIESKALMESTPHSPCEQLWVCPFSGVFQNTYNGTFTIINSLPDVPFWGYKFSFEFTDSNETVFLCYETDVVVK